MPSAVQDIHTFNTNKKNTTDYNIFLDKKELSIK